LAVLGPDGTPSADTVYALTAVDKSGRVADRGILAGGRKVTPAAARLRSVRHAGSPVSRV
jgi:hypothetical protein